MMTAAGKPAAQRPGEAGVSAIGQLGALGRALLRARGRHRVLAISAGLVAVIAINAAGQIRLNLWQGDFYDALARKATGDFLVQTLVFLAIVAVLLALVVSQVWLLEMLKARLREWLTNDLIGRWLAPSHAYRLGLAGEIGTNPDQRLHEDARKLTEHTAELGVGLLQSTLLLASFVGVLWTLSAGVAFHWGERTFTVPGYMVWCALAYAAGGSALAWWRARPLVRLNEALYGREAELRFGMVRVAESAEGIALYRGESDERARLGAMLDRVIDVMCRRAGGLAQLTWVTSAYGWLGIVAPVLVAAPGYFGGDLSFGGLMMVVGAFYQVQQALRWFVDNAPRIADWRATLTRVMALRDALDHIDRAARPDDAVPRLTVSRGDAPRFELRGVAVRLRNGEAHVAEGDVSVGRGERLLVVGAAGAGKSTLFRAIAGIWPWGRGEIVLPGSDGLLFLPNRPYLPPGTLRDSVIYPAPRGSVMDEAARTALSEVGLGHLAAELDREARWDRELALDEQQRLAFARVLLHRPGWLFMDDAASALGGTERAALRATLDRLLGDMTVIAFERNGEEHAGFPRRIHVVRTAVP
ncbi:ABC transporter ATP-binding protein/permease [Limibaculum sp. FT325]|uniref:ABC transporter ATP-binding protein/permease n=1 Tax=Thermohalobaculum sediminis TaxID=2939436 RepID=UPI0020BD530A|nr:ABC transporter ATP-binding protein/permease [Limibaculum sediminis]MCL5776176.1 ABC transporter ATP-binding protein/permease [Limibaculum sediminis]